MNVFERNRHMSQQGFTLIEVIISMVILGIGLLAIAQMQVVAIQTNTVNREVTEATTIALDKLEYLKVLPLDDDALTDVNFGNNSNLGNISSPEHSDPANPLDGGYTVIWNVADNEDTKSINVVVTYLSGRKQVAKLVELPTVILDK